MFSKELLQRELFARKSTRKFVFNKLGATTNFHFHAMNSNEEADASWGLIASVVARAKLWKIQRLLRFI